jgi:hypothetical protein
LRFRSGPAITDTVVWQPAGASWQAYRDIRGNDTSGGDLLGYFYSPLICLDRKWWHASHEMFEEDRAHDR